MLFSTQFIRNTLLMLAVSLTLIACSKISQKNFEKIQTNMNMQQVIAILGEPTSTDNISIAGISGTSAVWKDANGEIDIQFLNGHVLVKAFSKETDTDDAP